MWCWGLGCSDGAISVWGYIKPRAPQAREENTPPQPAEDTSVTRNRWQVQNSWTSALAETWKFLGYMQNAAGSEPRLETTFTRNAPLHGIFTKLHKGHFLQLENLKESERKKFQFSKIPGFRCFCLPLPSEATSPPRTLSPPLKANTSLKES